MEKPIGIFDSGVGGLTVVREIKKVIPDERIIYFGDTARVPYGTKSKETIIKFSSQIAEFLIEKEVKAILVACNTSSAIALTVLQKRYRVPIMGVIVPGAIAASQMTENKRIGVIGTPATINSGAYQEEIKKIDTKIRIFVRATTLLVPLIEEDNIPDTILYPVLEMYLSGLLKNDIDTLILGCTHYPIIKKQLEKYLRNKIKIVDSAAEAAKAMKNHLSILNKLNKKRREETDSYYVSDAPDKFRKMGERILNKKMKKVNYFKMDY